MKTNISRRRFVKLAGAASATLLAKISGLIPETRLFASGGSDPSEPVVVPLDPGDRRLPLVKVAAALANYNSERHGKINWSTAWFVKAKGQSVILVAIEPNSLEQRYLGVVLTENQPSAPVVIGEHSAKGLYKDVIAYRAPGDIIRGIRIKSDGTFEELSGHKVPGLPRPIMPDICCGIEWAECEVTTCFACATLPPPFDVICCIATTVICTITTCYQC